jgi:hypothetical protein
MGFRAFKRSSDVFARSSRQGITGDDIAMVRSWSGEKVQSKYLSIKCSVLTHLAS